MGKAPSILDFVSYYEKQGFSYFPLPFGEKSNKTFKWGEYQKRRPTREESENWFGNGAQHNVAIVCGKVSGNLVVLDCDSEDRFYELAGIISDRVEGKDILDITKVSQTGKGYHIWLVTEEPVKSAKFPKLDIKAEGGYIVAPPSLHPEGNRYKFANPLTPIRRIKSLIDIGIDLSQHRQSQPGQQENWVTEALKGIGQGGRNDTCYRLASYFKTKHPQDITERLLIDWNKKNSPPLDENEILQTIKSAYARSCAISPLEPPYEGNNRTISYYSPDMPSPYIERHKSGTENDTPRAEKLQEWIKESGGAWVSYDDLDKEFNIRTEAEKHNRREIVRRLKVSGIIEAHPKQGKMFRYVNVVVRLIDFKSALGRTSLTIKYPFGIEKYFKTYPGNIIVVAGAPDAGKTAFLLNTIRLNQNDFSIFYQSSEMGPDELSNRLQNFEGIQLDEWNFTAEERSSDFADVIRPDCVNIIDYMELCSDCYMVAEYLKQIHDKLNSGIAIVALQKNPNADQGRGGTFGLEKPRLYLNIDAGKIVIRKAKNWTNPTVNPNRLQMNFKIVAGCKFLQEGGWHQPDEQS